MITRYYFIPEASGRMENFDTSKFGSYSTYQHALGTFVRVEAPWAIHAKAETISGIHKFGNIFRPASVYPRRTLDLIYGVGVNPPAGEMVIDMINKAGVKLFGDSWEEIHSEQ